MLRGADGIGTRISILVAEIGAHRAQQLAQLLNEVTVLDPGTIEALAADVSGRATRSSVRTFLTMAPAAPGALAIGLSAAAATMTRSHLEGLTELVWTGPDGTAGNFRDTEQALLELIALAQRRLTLCAFAAYKIGSVCEAMSRAIRRGVVIEFIHEAPDVSEGRVLFDPINALETELRAAVQLLVWPRDQRPTNASGHFGSLHAKFALADAQAVFITSANLTEHALRLNVELGVLVQSNRLAQQLRSHLDRLIANRVLCRKS